MMSSSLSGRRLIDGRVLGREIETMIFTMPNQGPLERTTFDRFPVAGTDLVLSSLRPLGARSPFGRRSRNAALRLSDARRQPNYWRGLTSHQTKCGLAPSRAPAQIAGMGRHEHPISRTPASPQAGAAVASHVGERSLCPTHSRPPDLLKYNPGNQIRRRAQFVTRWGYTAFSLPNTC